MRHMKILVVAAIALIGPGSAGRRSVLPWGAG